MSTWRNGVWVWFSLLVPMVSGCTQADGFAARAPSEDVGASEASEDRTPCYELAGADDDRDGIDNGTEDKNGNCIWDELEETHWQSSDTDGDGLSDGDEDLNRNGRVDDGELDPKSSDSDGDGVIDSAEGAALICTGRGLRPIDVDGLAESGGLHLPEGFEVTEGEEPSVVLFESAGEGVFGFVVTLSETFADVEALHSTSLQRIQSDGFVREVTERAFTTWDGDEAKRTKARIVGSAGFDLGGYRDGLAAALSGVAITSEVATRGCAEPIVWQTSVLRGGSAQVVGVVACVDALTPRLRGMLEDLTNTTGLTRGTVDASRSGCEGNFVLEPHDVDLLWVIENSITMGEEQGAVAIAGVDAMAQLDAAGADWRMAVTTTEAYALDNSRLADPPLDRSSGLRGEGFIASGTVDAPMQFRQYVTQGLDCVPDSNGALVCQNDNGKGLASAATVLDALGMDARPEHALREGAQLAIVLVSNSEDGAFRNPSTGVPFPVGDVSREGALAQAIRPLEGLGAQVCAIVGDEGANDGGLCAGSRAAGGAQHGLGYIETGEAVAGLWGTVCSAVFDEVVSSCIDGALAKASRIRLSEPAISASLQVAVNGVVLERDRTLGWAYDPIEQAVVVYGYAGLSGAEVTVSYRVWSVQ